MNIVLVVGERPEQASALAERLGLLGIEAIPCARDWKLAIRCLTSHKISLMLLDVGDNDDSREFFNLVRELTEVPIIARGSITNPEQAIWYLNHGANDYVSRTMPSSLLVAKIKLLLQAIPAAAQAGCMRFGDLTIDVDHYLVSRAGQAVALTPIEFRLLRVLAESGGKACSQRTLLERVWGEEFRDCAHYLRLYMGYLRQKLEDDPKRPRMLLTEWGYGYRLVAAPRQPGQALRSVGLRQATG